MFGWGSYEDLRLGRKANARLSQDLYGRLQLLFVVAPLANGALVDRPPNLGGARRR